MMHWQAMLLMTALGFAGAAAAGADPAGTPLSAPLRVDVIYSHDNAPNAPGIDELPRRESITQYGITWTFDTAVPVGQFVTGDYYVVGPVTVTSVSPRPLFGDEVDEPTEQEHRDFPGQMARHGSVLNMEATAYPPFDSRTQGRRYNPETFAQFPVQMEPGDVLISTISVDDVSARQRMLGPSDHTNVSRVQSAAILICLAEPVPADAFRPAYAEPEPELYFARDLRRDLLPRLDSPDSARLQYMTRAFERPWIDNVFFGFTAPVDNTPQYGREVGRAAGMGTLTLMLDHDPHDQERLLLGIVQAGIDYWGLIRSGHGGYPAHGGHGSGRKWILVFTGLMLGDEDMQNPYQRFPEAVFGEDMQTTYGQGWTGARALYAGHVGPDGEQDRGWGLYEHLPPEQWEHRIGESYRNCCTSIAWVGQALAIHLMQAQEIWDHDAYLDYADRWMYEDNTEFRARIEEATGWRFGSQGSTWDAFVNDMWARYRTAEGMPPIDGWRLGADTSP
ncbi:MAG: hypothetical protein WD009_10400 [Phycisphaeraceae bacterium]